MVSNQTLNETKEINPFAFKISRVIRILRKKSLINKGGKGSSLRKLHTIFFKKNERKYAETTYYYFFA